MPGNSPFACPRDCAARWWPGLPAQVCRMCSPSQRGAAWWCCGALVSRGAPISACLLPVGLRLAPCTDFADWRRVSPAPLLVALQLAIAISLGWCDFGRRAGRNPCAVACTSLKLCSSRSSTGSLAIGFAPIWSAIRRMGPVYPMPACTCTCRLSKSHQESYREMRAGLDTCCSPRDSNPLLPLVAARLPLSLCERQLLLSPA